MPKSETTKRRDRLRKICESLPEVDCTGDHHLTFQVRKKKFAYYLNDHHGDGIVALSCKLPRGENETLVDFDPERFYMPSYVARFGYVALRMDLPAIDWDEVTELVTDAYRLAAPKRLSATLK